MKILYKFASRSRPAKFIEAVENIIINQRHEDYIILASLDTDDVTMNNEEMIAKMRNYKQLYPVFGTSKNKIDAVNRDMHLAPEWDILVNMSDDMRFCVNGFDREILEEYQKYLPDGDVLLHFPDQNQGKNCMTMSIMDKKYYDRFGYIYYPGYQSLWCDLEAQEVGKLLGRYKFCPSRIVNHYHPSFGQARYDDQYRKTESHEVRSADESLYIERKEKNFDLPIF